jgi:hypothetical protein
MAKQSERSPTSYLQDDWSGKPPGGDNASGVSETPDGPAPSVPFTQDAPLNPDWGMLGEGRGGFGHSSDVEDTGTKSSAWGMSKEDQARGYEGPERYDSGQYEQDIPQKNDWDRGAGSDTYAREHSETTGRGFDGGGNNKPSPGREALGSSSVKPGNLAD